MDHHHLVHMDHHHLMDHLQHKWLPDKPQTQSDKMEVQIGESVQLPPATFQPDIFISMSTQVKSHSTIKKVMPGLCMKPKLHSFKVLLKVLTKQHNLQPG